MRKCLRTGRWTQVAITVAAIMGCCSGASGASAGEHGSDTRAQLARKVSQEVAQLAPLHASDPRDGTVIDELKAKAYPSYQRLASLIGHDPGATRADALVLFRLAKNLSGLDPGPSPYEIVYDVRSAPAIQGLLSECGTGAAASQVLPDQGALQALGLAPLSEREVCEVKGLFDSISRLDALGNG